MGYLQIEASSLPNFSKAVISLWFRVPTVTFTAMSAVPYPSTDPDARLDTMCSAYYNPPLYKIIPLIVFGSVESDTDAHPVQPSFIGIDTIFDGLNALACNLQTPINGSMVGLTGNTGATRPGCFYMSGWTGGTGEPTNAYIAPDVWHHALISFDIGGSMSANYDTAGGTINPAFTSSCIFTWAIDDVDKVGLSLSPGGAKYSLYGLVDPKYIVTNWLTDGIGFGGFTGPAPPALAGDTASFSGGYISSFGNPIGIPVSSTLVSNGRKIELAELQIYTGVTLDASNLTNRRAFIKADGSPETDYSIAEALLGKAPEIRLHGSTNWKVGNNSGSLEENFTKNEGGTINTYGTNPDITP